MIPQPSGPHYILICQSPSTLLFLKWGVIFLLLLSRLAFLFSIYTMMWLVLFLFVFILLEVYWAFESVEYGFPSNLGKFWTTVSSNIFCPFLSFLSLCDSQYILLFSHRTWGSVPPSHSFPLLFELDNFCLQNQLFFILPSQTCCWAHLLNFLFGYLTFQC